MPPNIYIPQDPIIMILKELEGEGATLFNSCLVCYEWFPFAIELLWRSPPVRAIAHPCLQSKVYYVEKVKSLAIQTISNYFKPSLTSVSPA
ncbi:hypothetical protein K470DRAFT_259247 [Piedraia hortae CBS 480.64]|uniref:F-box domain-containing protein n=1 Tax=Piedraia hortae CBS 480.64 TaxID=1314780 RepID=A0A6A7BVH0_9PEZI|nr:hypothetical protein K470DRAFT_259247 [Piedraia hortae CBS 480.64]